MAATGIYPRSHTLRLRLTGISTVQIADIIKAFLGTGSMAERSNPGPGRSSENGAVDAAEAIRLIASGEAPDGLEVSEPISIYSRSGTHFSFDSETIKIEDNWRLPANLKAPSISMQFDALNSLPEGLTARSVAIQSKNLRTIGSGLNCKFLDLLGTSIEQIPDNVTVSNRMILENCRQLTRLPDNLTVGSLNLKDCVALKELPKGLNVTFLDIEGCSSLRKLPEDLTLNGGRLNARDCYWLSTLPENLGDVAELDLAGCLNLARLPDGLNITSWIDIAGTSITELPERFDHVGLRWRGVAISRRIIFEPETLTPDEIFNEKNAEVRRVMMERYGYENLMEAANAIVLDEDEDRGGPRRLLKVEIEDDEDLVVVDVRCPSTGHRFFLRVPPTMQSCHQAVAWTAGFDDPSLYNPQIET